MSKQEILEKVLATEDGAQTLLNVIVEKWGAADLLWCMFDIISEDDQADFLNCTISRMEVA